MDTGLDGFGLVFLISRDSVSRDTVSCETVDLAEKVWDRRNAIARSAHKLPVMDLSSIRLWSNGFSNSAQVS